MREILIAAGSGLVAALVVGAALLWMFRRW